MNFKLSLTWFMTCCFVFFSYVTVPQMATAGDMKIITKDVAYLKGVPSVKGYLAKPDDGKRHPGIILIHEWWGLNENIKQNAREFAELGYVALAVDLYNGKNTTDRKTARKLATHVRKNRSQAFDNLRAAIDFLRADKQSVIPDRLAGIGWCFGGGWSYQMAKNDLGVKASIIYYGFFNPKDDLAKMRALILGNFGEKDRAIKVDNVRELQVRLSTLNGNHEVYIYQNAGHGFANPGNPNYDKEAADLAWNRTLRFLEKYL